MFLRKKVRNILAFAVLFVMLAFSAAFATTEEVVVLLTLKAQDGFDLRNVSLDLFVGTDTTAATGVRYPLTPTTSSDYHMFLIQEPGTYTYRVTGTNNYYGSTKLIHITQADFGLTPTYMEIPVYTGRRAANANERFEVASVNMFTNQIENTLFRTNNLTGFPSAGYQTPTFTTNKLIPFQYTTQADLMKFVNDVANGNPKVHLFSLGKTNAMNYDIPILIITDSVIPAGATFEEAAKIIRENSKPTFFHQGQIHGGEVSSGEGAMALIQEMAGAYGATYLNKINFVSVPRFNVDGAAIANRGTLDPEIDMNRDHLRVRALENRMVHRAYLEIMPEVVMDGHEIGYYGVTATTAANATVVTTTGLTDIEATPSTSMNNPSSKVVDLALDLYAKNIFNQLNAGGTAGLRVNHYQNGSDGWTTNHGIGRAYYGLMGSISMLVEVRGTGSLLMQRRIHSHVATAKSMIETLYNNAELTKALVKEGRENLIAKGKKYDPNSKVYLAQYASGNTSNFLSTGTMVPGSKYTSYVGRRYQSDILGNIIAPSGSDREKPLAINDKSHRDRSRPTAYIIPKGITSTSINSGDYAINYDYLKEMMDANRIEYYELKPKISANVRQYYYVSGSPTASASNGATLSTNVLLANIRDEARVTFTEGAYVIPMDQVAAAVAMCTFEPDIANSNGFNAAVTQSLTGDEGLALIFRSLTTNNYPYYRFEKDNPRILLPSVDCKENVHNLIDHLNEHGCNAGFGFALILLIPFIFRRR